MTTQIKGVMKPGFIFEYESQPDGTLTQLSVKEQKVIFNHFVSRNVNASMTIKFDGYVWNDGINLYTFERVGDEQEKHPLEG